LYEKTYRYVSKRPSDEAVRNRLRELAHERRRFGYRRLHLLLGREGIRLNRKKLYRLYNEKHLTVRKRGGRKRALGTRAPMTVPQGINQRWSLDFVSDALLDSRRFRILAVIDDFSRIIENWRLDYNTERPHTSLDGLTPTEFATRPAKGHNQNGLYL
jgi:putative transposase